MTRNLILSPMQPIIPLQPIEDDETPFPFLLIVRSAQPIYAPGWVNSKQAECMPHLWLNYRRFDTYPEMFTHSRHIKLDKDDYMLTTILIHESEAGSLMPGDERCAHCERGENLQAQYLKTLTLHLTLQPWKLESWRQLIARAASGETLSDKDYKELKECHEFLKKVEL